jgi:AraC family transcriptional regulator
MDKERRFGLARHPLLSIADITYKVSFANQGHLTSHFKRLLGITPKVVREK